MIEVSTQSRIITTAVFIVYLLFLVGIGIYANRAMKASKEGFAVKFFAGNRDMGPIVVGLMMGATMCSAGTFVSGPGLGYKQGLIWVTVVLSSAFMNFYVLGTAGKKIGIMSRRIGAVSYTHLLRSRYNNNKFIGLVVPVLTIVFFSAYIVSQFIGGARLMEAMTGMSYFLSLFLFAVVVLIYTVFGGMKGVSLTIVLQGFLMTLSCFLLMGGVLGRINTEIGGLEAAFKMLAEVEPSIISPNTYSIPMTLSFFVMYGIVTVGWPHTVQGAITYKDTKSLHGAIISGIIVVAIWQGVMTMMGPFARILNPELAVADHATQYLSLTTLNPFFSGIIMAGAASAIQSTIAGMLIIVSSNIVKELYIEYINPKSNDKKQQKITVISTIILIAVIFLFSLNPPDFLQLLITFALGGLGATFYASMFFGLYWKRANEYGAIASLIGGFVYYFISSIVIKSLAFGMQPIVMSSLVSTILLVAVSLATPKTPKNVIQLWFGKVENKIY